MEYRNYRPTGFDTAGLNLPEKQNWLVAPCGQSRDSGPFDHSNFATCLKWLGGESETVEVHRFGHWACGWFEIILVEPGTAAAGILDEIVEKLDNYPILDEGDLSERESLAAEKSWNSWGFDEFIREVKEQNKFEASRGANWDAVELLHEWNKGDAFNIYCQNAPEPYSEDCGGIDFPCLDHVAGRLGRDGIAAILRSIRAGCDTPGINGKLDHLVDIYT